jgi:hypothetical protein
MWDIKNAIDNALKTLSINILVFYYLMQASVLIPPMFIAHDPQIPSLHDLLNVSVGSISFLILTSASSTMGPHAFRSTSYSCILGFSPPLALGFQR